MASRTSQPVAANTSTTGNVTVLVEDLKKWTGRIVTNDPSTKTFSYQVRVVGSASETASQGYLLKSGSSVGDVLLNNNDGDGQPFTAYALYISWSSLTSGGAINVLFREEY